MSASMLRAAISLRTAVQRRSSSGMEMGVSTRSMAAMMRPSLWNANSEWRIANRVISATIRHSLLAIRSLHNVAHLLRRPIHERAQIVDEKRHHLLGIGLGHAADMRGDDDIRGVPERAFGRQRLGLEHVEAGARDAA